MSFPDDMSNIPYVSAFPVRNIHCDECDESPEDHRLFEFYEPEEQRELVADLFDDEADLQTMSEAFSEMAIPRMALVLAAFRAGDFAEVGRLMDKQFREYGGVIVQENWNGR